jgi:hypothetical protein
MLKLTCLGSDAYHYPIYLKPEAITAIRHQYPTENVATYVRCDGQSYAVTETVEEVLKALELPKGWKRV